MPFSRYVVESVVFFVFIFYLCTRNLISSVKILRMFLLFTFLLIFTQAFKAVDPSPRIIFGTKYLGRNISSPFFGTADGLVYNTQFVFIDGLVKEIIAVLPKNDGIMLDIGSTYFFNNIFPLTTVESLNTLNRSEFKNLVYIYIPWFTNEEESLTRIGKYYRYSYYKTISYRGYYVKLYNLSPI